MGCALVTVVQTCALPISLLESPVGGKLEARHRRVFPGRLLRCQRPLEKRPRVGIDELGIDQLFIAIGARRYVPFARDVLTPERDAELVELPPSGRIVDPDIVVAFWSDLEPDPRNGAVGDEQARCAQPEHPRLERVAIATDCDCLGHRLPLMPYRRGTAALAPLSARLLSRASGRPRGQGRHR